MVQEKTRDAPSPAPTVCLHCMMFFGNPAFDNLCSQCYKASNGGAAPQQQPASSAITADAHKPMVADNHVSVESEPTVSTNDAIVVTNEKALLPAPSADKDQDETASVTSSTPSVAGPEYESSEEEGGRRKQKNPGRCWSCKKKVVFAKQVTNKCRCEYVFCDAHRQAEMHDCDYDHKSAGRDRLGKNAGPACVADKVVRI